MISLFCGVQERIVLPVVCQAFYNMSEVKKNENFCVDPDEFTQNTSYLHKIKNLDLQKKIIQKFTNSTQFKIDSWFNVNWYPFLEGMNSFQSIRDCYLNLAFCEDNIKTKNLLINILDNCKNTLENLQIDGNIDDEKTYELSTIPIEFDKLTNLTFQHEARMDMFGKCDKLFKLVLNHTRLHPSIAGSQINSVKVLELNFIRGTYYDYMSGCDIMKKMAASLSNLEICTINDSGWTSAAMQSFLNGFRSNNKLEHLVVNSIDYSCFGRNYLDYSFNNLKYCEINFDSDSSWYENDSDFVKNFAKVFSKSKKYRK